MPRDRDEWLSRLKSIEREALVMRLAATRLREQVPEDQAILSNGGIASRDLEVAVRHLEGTYAIRLFAEFEMGLREYWATIKFTHPRTKDLVDGLASHQGIPHPLIAATHSVREYRNSLVHQRTEGIVPIPLSIVRSVLCRYASRLPENWA